MPVPPLLSLSVRHVKRFKKCMSEGGGGGSGTSQPRSAQPSSPARIHKASGRAAGTLQVRRLQRSPSLRKAYRGRRPFAQSRNASSFGGARKTSALRAAKTGASASREQKCDSIRRPMVESRSTPATPASSAPTTQRGCHFYAIRMTKLRCCNTHQFHRESSMWGGLPPSSLPRLQSGRRSDIAPFALSRILSFQPEFERFLLGRSGGIVAGLSP